MHAALRMERWSPYAVGAGIGVLSWITFFFMDKALGVSTSMVHIAGALEGLVDKAHVEANPYFAGYLVGKPVFEWQMALVVMLIAGAFVAARLAGSRFTETVPPLWAWRFGPSPMVRYIGAFLGGVVLLYGARMAGGCTSGHGISGGMQLALSSWTFIFAMFGGGVAAAFAIFGTEGRNHV